jgi:flagellar hook-associated protein 3 FlgL
MRISERQRFHAADERITHSRLDNTRLMEQLSTQKRVTRISDDPSSLSHMFTLRDRISGSDGYQKSIDYAKGFLTRSEASLTDINDSLIRAKELAVSMANDTYGPDSREATAREIKQLIQGIISSANSKYGDRFVFSGYRTQTPSMAEDGKYLGDDGEIFLQIAPGNFQKINVTARELFEPSADQRAEGRFGMLEALDLLYSGLINNDKDQIHKSMTELEFQMEKTSSFQATLGSLSNALEVSEQRLGLDKQLSTELLSRIEDADLLDSTSQFKRSEAIMQSTLLASNKMLQPSLLNFMQ